MSDNKIDGELDFRNIKQTQFSGSQVLKGSFSELQSSLRVYNTNSIIKDGFTHFIQTVNSDGLPTLVEYWQALSTAKDKLTVVADVSDSLASKYFALQEYNTKKVHVFYFVVSGTGTAPGIGDVETAITLTTDDSTALVARATSSAVNAISEFTAVQPTLLSEYIEIEYFQFGDSDAINVATSGFTTLRTTEGVSNKVGSVYLEYNSKNEVIYGGATLKDMRFNPYSASFDAIARQVAIDDTSLNLDAFHRIRISDINNIFESTHVNSEQTEFWDYSVTGGATKTYVPAESCIKLACGTASGDKAIRQTLNYFHYAAGQSMIVRFTGVIGSGKTNVTQSIGYFDDENGLIFSVVDGVFGVTVRSNTSGSVVDTRVTQANFNIDKLDGTGASGYTIDLDKTQIFEVNYQWLGVGIVHFFVHIDGKVILLHRFHNANTQTKVYMRTPHLPVRYEIENTGISASATTLLQICTQVANEGKSVSGDLISSVDNGTTTRSVTASAFKQLISFRAKSAADITIQIENVNVLVTSNDDLLIEVRVDQTLTGASWVSTSEFIEKDVSTSAVANDGRLVLSFYISKKGKNADGQFKDKFRLGKFLNGTKQTFTVSAKSVSSNAQALCSVSFKEFF